MSEKSKFMFRSLLTVYPGRKMGEEDVGIRGGVDRYVHASLKYEL
jgi:hypothetical protein